MGSILYQDVQSSPISVHMYIYFVIEIFPLKLKRFSLRILKTLFLQSLLEPFGFMETACNKLSLASLCIFSV